MAAEDGLVRVSKRNRRPNFRYVDDSDEEQNVERKNEKSDYNGPASNAKLPEATNQLSESMKEQSSIAENGSKREKKITEPTSSKAVVTVINPKQNVEKKNDKSDYNRRASKAKLPEATSQLSESLKKQSSIAKKGSKREKKIAEPTSSKAVDTVINPKTNTKKPAKHEVSQVVRLPKKPEPVVETRICKRQELRPKLKKKIKIEIDYSEMAKEKLDSNNFDIVDYNNYLVEKMKVENPQEVQISQQEFKLVVSSTQVDKPYLKYLTKKYLNKARLKDWIHVGGKKKNSLKLCYYRMAC